MNLAECQACLPKIKRITVNTGHHLNFLTLGKFGVVEAAVHLGAVPITLIDGEALLDLLVKNGVDVLPLTLPATPFSVDTDLFSEHSLTLQEDAASA